MLSSLMCLFVLAQHLSNRLFQVSFRVPTNAHYLRILLTLNLVHFFLISCIDFFLVV